MKVLKFTQSIFISLVLLAALSISSFAKTGKGSSVTAKFRIPKKIMCVDDLPEELRQNTKKEVIKIQLFPEEIVAVEKTDVQDPIELIEENIFHVVTGSFNLKKNAHRLATSLKNNGYDQTCVEFYETEGLYRVIVQRYDNEESAEAYLHQFRNENPILDLAWLYQGKKMQQEYLALSQLN